jgi:hypothetical protein
MHAGLESSDSQMRNVEHLQRGGPQTAYPAVARASPVDLVKKQATFRGCLFFYSTTWWGSKLCGRRTRIRGASEAKPARKGDLPLEPWRASPVCKLRDAFVARRPADGPTKGRRKGEPRMPWKRYIEIISLFL